MRCNIPLSFYALSIYALSIIPVVTPAPLLAHSSLALASRQQTCDCTGVAPTAKADPNTYLCDNQYLGPASLAAASPMISSDYSPLGALCPAEFLATYFNQTLQGYNWPPEDGFQLKAGVPDRHKTTLVPPLQLDRFGGERGHFLARAATPFGERALPPMSLTAPYHVYNVMNSFTVWAGPIAPWFGQPGLGEQYYTDQTIAQLLQGGFLQEVTAS